mmetsp:Transcript_72858/g.202061  ORF Transcript_72858/g.202061 Transcript_72858/m.202061 type:complete len:237 (-) Transcript_72858:171-881(-)
MVVQKTPCWSLVTRFSPGQMQEQWKRRVNFEQRAVWNRNARGGILPGLLEADVEASGMPSAPPSSRGVSGGCGKRSTSSRSTCGASTASSSSSRGPQAAGSASVGEAGAGAASTRASTSSSMSHPPQMPTTTLLQATGATESRGNSAMSSSVGVRSTPRPRSDRLRAELEDARRERRLVEAEVMNLQQPHSRASAASTRTCGSGSTAVSSSSRTPNSADSRGLTSIASADHRAREF